MINPEMVLIIKEGGLPLYSKVLNAEDEEVLPILISSFLSAIQSFSSELSESEKSDIEVALGNQFLKIHKRGNFSVAVIVNEDLAGYNDLVINLANLLETNLLPIVDVDGDLSGIESLIDSYLYNLLSEIKIADNYVPKIISQLPKQYAYLEDLIDNSRSFIEISEVFNLKLEDLKSTLYQLQLKGFIVFGDTLKEDSVISKNHMTAKRLLSGNSICNTRVNTSGILISPCNTLGLEGCNNVIKSFDTTSFVKDLSYIDNDNKKGYLDCLLLNNLLTKLDPYGRTIWVVKNLIEGLLKTMRKRLNENSVRDVIQNAKVVLEGIGFANEINTSGDPYVNLDMQRYLTFEKQELKSILSAWVDYMNELVLLIPKNREAIINDLMENYSTIFMDLVATGNNSKTDKIQEFLFQLELMV